MFYVVLGAGTRPGHHLSSPRWTDFWERQGATWEADLSERSAAVLLMFTMRISQT
jgi:hypothetical protein